MGRNWVHVALASVSRFVLDLRLGPRTKEEAVQLVASVGLCGQSAPQRPAPLFLMDDHLPYPSAILEVYGTIRHGRRRGGRGRRKHPRLKPPKGMLVGVVKKARDATGNLLSVKTQALYGPKKAIIGRVKELGIGTTINTAHVERINGTLRCQQARLSRRTRSVSRRRRFLQWSLWLWRDLYNWVRPHRSLHEQTPAVAQGLADGIWSVWRYVCHPVHVCGLMRDIWSESREIIATSALKAKKRLETVPTS
jgi:Integrase core domain